MSKLKEEKKYVVSDISETSISLVDIENGDELNINLEFVNISNSWTESNEKENHSYTTKDKKMSTIEETESDKTNTYKINKKDFLELNLTDTIKLENNQLYVSHENVEIKNDLAWRLLEDIYISEEETEGMQYKVVEIKENKIYLTNYDGTGGYFSIFREVYPELEVGDVVEKHNKKYIKI